MKQSAGENRDKQDQEEISRVKEDFWSLLVIYWCCLPPLVLVCFFSLFLLILGLHLPLHCLSLSPSLPLSLELVGIIDTYILLSK